MIATAAKFSLDLNTVIAWLVQQGVPQSVADDLKVIEGRAQDIVWMVICDGKDAAIAFIAAEKAKVLAALGVNMMAKHPLGCSDPLNQQSS